MRRRAFCTLLLTAPLLATARDALCDDFVLIRNAKNSTTSASKADVRKLFTGQTKQWSGAVVQVVLGEEGTGELGWLASAIFDGSPKEVLAKIKQEIFRGEMKRPVVAKSSEDCIAAVARSDGAVGVITAAAAKALPATVATLKLSG